MVFFFRYLHAAEKIQSTAVVAIGERKEISKAILSSRPEWTGSSTQEKALAFSERGDIHSVTGNREERSQCDTRQMQVWWVHMGEPVELLIWLSISSVN